MPEHELLLLRAHATSGSPRVIATHQFVKKPGHTNCEYRLGGFVCAQTRSYHKRKKKPKEAKTHANVPQGS